jgi:hypothetical protein
MQTDARGQRICLYYNDLNRLVSKHYCNDDSCPSNPTLDVKYIYSGTFFLDDFEDGIDSGDWDSLGSVSASNGQVHIVGNGDWQDWLKRDESTEDGQGARFSFKISTISALALPAFEQWTWNTTQFRRWGILLEDGKIKNESILGTNPAVKVDLLTLKANT